MEIDAIAVYIEKANEFFCAAQTTGEKILRPTLLELASGFADLAMVLTARERTNVSLDEESGEAQ